MLADIYEFFHFTEELTKNKAQKILDKATIFFNSQIGYQVLLNDKVPAEERVLLQKHVRHEECVTFFQ